MQLEPRQQILDIWRHAARVSYQDGRWYPGGRDGSNSISDAEQLLCVMGPATELAMFRLDRPDTAARDVLDALLPLGDDIQVPQRLIQVLTLYIDRYTSEDGTPQFSGGSYFVAGGPGDGGGSTEEQRGMDVVDSFAASVTLMLAVVGFAKVFRQVVTRAVLLHQIDELEAKANTRLTAALVGLLRSFSVNVFSTEGELGRNLITMVNQERRPARMVIEELRAALGEINVRLRDDVTIGSGAAEGGALENPNRLFECGWSWGLVKGAPVIDTSTGIGQQHDGVAENAPYLYFTTVALDAIQALSSERTRLLGLLDPEQSRLAGALQLRFELTRSYWATIATFGSGRWPLEDLPWQTTDGLSADHFSLLVGGMVMQDMVATRATNAELRRVGLVLEEVANRSRITRRSTPGETAIRVHHPGIPIELVGSRDRGGPQLYWTVADIAPMLLKRTLGLAGLVTDGATRSRLLDLSGDIWTHLRLRVMHHGPGEGLWDQPAGAFPQIEEEYTAPSWYYVKRVVDCLVTAARSIADPPVRSDLLAQIAADLLAEADHLYDRELLNGPAHRGTPLADELDRIGVELRRARSVRTERPGVAVAVTEEVLRKLDRLSAARRADAGGSPL